MNNDEKASFLYELAKEIDDETSPVIRLAVAEDGSMAVSDWLRARALCLPLDPGSKKRLSLLIKPEPETTEASIEPLPAEAYGVAAESRDQRIEAWDKVARHPAFKTCYDSPGPLLGAMLARLDLLWRCYKGGAE